MKDKDSVIRQSKLTDDIFHVLAVNEEFSKSSVRRNTSGSMTSKSQAVSYCTSFTSSSISNLSHSPSANHL